MGGRSGTVGRRDKSPSSSNWRADSKEPLPECQNTYWDGEWRCEVEQYQKLSSDTIGRPSVDLQSTIASPPPILPPVFARSTTTRIHFSFAAYSWPPQCKHSGKTPSTGCGRRRCCRDSRMYDRRHTFASFLLSSKSTALDCQPAKSTITLKEFGS